MATWKRIITEADDSNYKNSNIVTGDLPIATGSAVGGVKVGSNLSVDANGLLSASAGSNTTNSSLAFATGTGVVTLTDSAGGSVTVDLDGRYVQDSISITGDTTSTAITQLQTIDFEGGTGISTDADTDTLTITNTAPNVSTNLSVTHNANDVSINSSDGTNASMGKATVSQAGVMTSAYVTALNANSAKTGISSSQASAITANTAKVGITTTQANAITANTAKTSNVTTNLGITGTTGARVITSSDGTNATIPVASSSVSGVMSKATFDEHVANTAKVSASGIVSCTESSVKSILNALDSNDTLEIGDSDNDCQVNINGNLTIKGTTTQVDSNTVNIGDNILVLNADETGTPSQNAGFTVERGTQLNASLIWAENADRFLIDYDSKKPAIATVQFAETVAPTNTNDEHGVGSFWQRSGTHELYVRTA
jgi:hypothetical protein